MRRVHVIVAGAVQGVGYRYTMRTVARAEGVTGWVRNLRDGTVEAEFQGDESTVDAVLAWMAEGPPGSSVTSAEVHEVEVASSTRAETTFDVRADG